LHVADDSLSNVGVGLCLSVKQGALFIFVVLALIREKRKSF